MRELKSEITIDAPRQAVWAILTAIDLYPEWNPFITSIEGTLAVGKSIRVRIATPAGKPMTFRPICLERAEAKRLRWLGSLWIRGVFDGEHIFELESTRPNNTRFIQREKFSGILVPLLWSSLANKTLRGFEAMNQKLKSRAEG